VRCDGFAAEEYDAYALGTLESDRDGEIRSHLNGNCETCLPRVKQSLRLWSIFGAAVAPDAERLDEGRVRVVPLIKDSKSPLQFPTAPPSSTQQMRPSRIWRSMAIAASVALVTGTASWFFASSVGRSQGQQELAAVRSQLETATHEMDRLRQEASVSSSAAADLRARAQQVADLQALLAQREKQIRVLTENRNDLTNRLQLAQARATEGNRILEVLSLPNTRLIPVPGTDVAPGATGYALLAENNRVVFHANNLPALPAGRVYQLWLIRGQAPQIVSGGIFNLDAARAAEIEFTQGSLVQNVQAIAVTDEPAGGSPGPTGQKFLVGAVKS
jgi:anti-sigma-K factor RskA